MASLLEFGAEGEYGKILDGLLNWKQLRTSTMESNSTDQVQQKSCIQNIIDVYRRDKYTKS